MKNTLRKQIERFLNAKIRVYPSQHTARGDAIYAQGYFKTDDGSDPGRRLGYVGQEQDIIERMATRS